jgi:hypothetical protein
MQPATSHLPQGSTGFSLQGSWSQVHRWCIDVLRFSQLQRKLHTQVQQALYAAARAGNVQLCLWRELTPVSGQLCVQVLQADPLCTCLCQLAHSGNCNIQST